MRFIAIIVFGAVVSVSQLFSQVECLMPPPGPPGPMSSATQEILSKGEPFLREVSEPGQSVIKGQARGVWQALVILIDFPDYRWNHQHDPNFDNDELLYTPNHFDEMLFSVGSFKHPNSSSLYTGSMRDFYLENSYEQFDLSGITTAWYTALEPLSYYADDKAGMGAYPKNARRLVEEAVMLADADVDFSRFDNTGDGRVDALFVVHAGPGAEEIYTNNFPEHARYLWSHKSAIDPTKVDGVTVDGYTLEPENGTIGVFCHEFGHTLGLPDLYDTDNSSEGIGEWGLMGGGGWCHRVGDPIGTSPAHFTAWSKERLGWLDPINVTDNLLQVEIPPIEAHPVAYRLWSGGETGPEYFLVENRQNIGFDIGLTRRQKDFALPDAHGLIIYHIDAHGSQSNERRRMVDIEEASPYFDQGMPLEHLDLKRILPEHEFLTNGNRGDNGDPFPGFSTFNEHFTDFLGQRTGSEFSPHSAPNSNSNNDNPTNVSVTNIREVGSKIVADLLVSPITSVDLPSADPLPSDFFLEQNYPNPFNPNTRIRYAVSVKSGEGATVTLRIYNTRGQSVRTLVNGWRSAGWHAIDWDGRDDAGKRLGSGIYVYELRVGALSLSRKMLFLR